MKNRLTPQETVSETIPAQQASDQKQTVVGELLVQRLRLEAALMAQQLVTRSCGHSAILLPYPGFVTGVVIAKSGDSGFAVEIRACLGEALLADAAQAAIQAGNPDLASQQFQVTDAGLVSVYCHRQFAGPVDTATALEALEENTQVAFRVQAAIAEDCYLKPPELTNLLTQKGRF